MAGGGDPMEMLRAMGLDFGPKFWDNPMVANLVFHARKSSKATRPDIRDGNIPVDASTVTSLGYRLYLPGAGAQEPIVMVHFHGNGEVASDMDSGIQAFRDMGLAVLAIDYRGYGWSEGSLPLISELMSDSEKVAKAVPGLLQGAGLGNAKVILYGRSLGATCVTHIAGHETYGKDIKGVIVEAGLMSLKALPITGQLGMMIPGGAGLLEMVPEPFDSCTKVARFAQDLPLLVLHGDKDELIPVSEAVKCHAASTSANKKICRFPLASHNDISHTYQSQYLAAIKEFVSLVRGGAGGGASLSEEEVHALSIKELKALLAARGVDARAAVEKSDLVNLALGQ